MTALRYSLSIEVDRDSSDARSDLTHVVLLNLMRKDGRPDRRRQMPFEFAKAQFRIDCVHLVWADAYCGTAGELTLLRDGTPSRAAVREVRRRLNDLSKRRPYRLGDARQLVVDIRAAWLALEVMES